ncbi:MAG: hypothetical protein N2691_06060 [Patescibacteria group bacterium]|nr:hypothetical protein [Patescibacteria group bacterium]
MSSEIALRQIALNTTGMNVLLAWGILNLVVGLFLAFRFNKKQQMHWFFLMNAMWGGINTAIAGGAIFFLGTIQPAQMELRQIIYLMFNFEKILVFSMGLNIAYVAIGAFLSACGAHEKKPVLLGFGRAIQVQGGALLLFDTALLLLNMPLTKEYGFSILF